MKIRETIACATCADINNYLYYVLSTGLFQTYRGWVSSGRPNPHVIVRNRKEPTTRAEIASLFELSRIS